MTRFVVVLVHGWPVTDYHWRYVRPAFEDAGLPTVSWSPPGLGCPASAAAVFTKRALADELGGWLHDRGIRDVVLVGHDWGATIGWMLAARRPDLIRRLVIEEEVLPGVDVVVPQPGADFYPSWHGPFNRAVGLAEALVPGREDAYFGQFLSESAGPAGLEADAVQNYLAAYRPAAALMPALSYYRTRATDVGDVAELRRTPPTMPILAIGGRFAMGHAVAVGLRAVGGQIREANLQMSGHYPAEQEPATFVQAVLDFIAASTPPTQPAT